MVPAEAVAPAADLSVPEQLEHWPHQCMAMRVCEVDIPVGVVEEEEVEAEEGVVELEMEGKWWHGEVVEEKEVVRGVARHGGIGCCVCNGKHDLPWAGYEGRAVYRLFQCASVGCLACVKSCVLDEKTSVLSKSDRAYYTVFDWIKWGLEKGLATPEESDAVVDFLTEQLKYVLFGVVKASGGGSFFAACRGGHAPIQLLEKGLEYEYFYAARDGCLSCVKRALSVHCINASIKSDIFGYDALDFVKLGREHLCGRVGSDHVAVKEYIESFMDSVGYVVV